MALLLAFSSLLGLGLGVASAQLRDNRDPTLRSADQINDAGQSGRVVLMTNVQPQATFIIDEPKSISSRVIMGLMAETLADADDRRTSIVLVTAANGDGHKSTIAINMALAAARRGERVLLIDGDADTHELTDLIQANGLPGLGDVLGSDIKPSEATINVTDFGLDIMPLGARQFTSSGRTARNMTAAIQTLSKPYDVVVVDGGSIPQGQMIGVWMRAASRILVVARQGASNRSRLNDALAGLSREQAAKTRTIVISRS
jgi:polysaccharide biosynthesis transport protein